MCKYFFLMVTWSSHSIFNIFGIKPSFMLVHDNIYPQLRRVDYKSGKYIFFAYNIYITFPQHFLAAYRFLNGLLSSY
jgi:hypothetical protein